MQFDSGYFTFRTGTSPSESMRISSSGVVTKPYHPSFLAGGISSYNGSRDNAFGRIIPSTEYYDNCNNMNNCLEIKDIPIRLINLIEKINLAFLRNQSIPIFLIPKCKFYLFQFFVYLIFFD